jgi:large subunit ribosomal protein L13
MVVIDADGCVAGRLASSVAKRLLEGEEIIIVNAENAVVSGNPKAIEKFFLEKVDKGDPYHGPFYPKDSEKVLRRIIRGMLPFHKTSGREAFRRLKVYRSVPDELKNEGIEVIEKAKIRLDHKFSYLKNISKRIGGE